MAKRLPSHLPRAISQHVPLMTFAADVIDGVHIASLGAPATAGPNGILTAAAAEATVQTHTVWANTFDGSAGTSLTSVNGQLDTSFGRCLSMTGTAGSDHVVTVRGRDYLGQPMRENATLNGTAVIVLEKAFKFVDQVDVAVGAAGDTFALGWDDRLGLPFAAEQLLSWTEDNIQVEVGEDTINVVAVNCVAADTVFGMSNNAGFVTRIDTVVNIATQAGATAIALEIGGTVAAGSAVTVAASAPIGAVDTASLTDDHGATTKLGANAAIEVTSDGGTATTGTLDAFITVQQGAFFIDRDTTAVTATTGDTRGTVQPHTACDGSIEYEVRYSVDLASLHGLVQFNG